MHEPTSHPVRPSRSATEPLTLSLHPTAAELQAAADAQREQEEAQAQQQRAEAAAQAEVKRNVTAVEADFRREFTALYEEMLDARCLRDMLTLAAQAEAAVDRYRVKAHAAGSRWPDHVIQRHPFTAHVPWLKTLVNPQQAGGV